MSSSPFKPNLYVLARIVEVLSQNGPMRRTRLSTMANISYDKLERYLEWMAERGLVYIDGDGYVRLTERGVETYNVLVEWIRRYVGSLRV